MRSGDASPCNDKAGTVKSSGFSRVPSTNNGIVLDAQPRGKLAGPRILRCAFLVRQRDGVRKLGIRRPLERDDRGHRRPVGQVGRAGIQQPMKRGIGGVPRQVVIVACVVVARAAIEIAQRPHDRQVMGLLGQMRQVFAQLDARRRGGHGAKQAAILERGCRLHVPGVDVRRPAGEPDHDRRFGDFAVRRPGRALGDSGRGDAGQVGSKEAQPTGHEKRAAVDRIVASSEIPHGVIRRCEGKTLCLFWPVTLYVATDFRLRGPRKLTGGGDVPELDRVVPAS